jgi:hypothetical protein
MNIKPIKYSFFLVVLSLVALLGCGKDPEPLQPNYGPGGGGGGTVEYTVKGVQDISVERVGAAKFQVNIERISGSKTAEVQLAVADLPPGMEAVVDVPKGTPSFVAFVNIIATRVLEGNYKLVLVTSSGAAVKSQPFMVKVLPYSNHSHGMKGDYVESHNCTSDGKKDINVTILADENVANKVIIRGFWSGTHTNQVVGYLEPTSQKITIPEQTVFDVTFKGEGTYTDDQINLNYTTRTQIFSETCTAVLNRKK